MNLIEQGIEKGLIEILNDGKQVNYIHQGKKRSLTNPEEEVQLETFLKLVLVYGYPVERIAQFKTVTMASSTKEADIIVYNDIEHTKPHIVVECKKAEVSELEFLQAVEQAASYAYALSGTIKYIWITSGIKDVSFRIDKDSNVKQTVPNIPRFGVTDVEKYKYAKGGRVGNEEVGDDPVKQRFFELEIIDENDLTTRFKQAHNSLWAGGELNPSEAFDELDKLIFCKIWDERKPRRNGEPYDFQVFNEPIPKNATKEEKEKIEEKISKDLYKRILSIYDVGKTKDPEVFKDGIRLNHTKVKTVVGYLESVNLSATDLDSKGKAFETFMGSYFRGDFGQYFTPRPIVQFIVDVLPITNESRVLDTSCGSGGFLLYALDKVRDQAGDYYPDQVGDPSKGIPEGRDHHRHWHDFAEKNLFGIEINEQIARTAKMNMIIHDDGHTNVIASDGLLDAEVMVQRSGRQGFQYDSFDFIITNPPFGSSVKLNEKAYLKNFDLGNKDVSWLDLKNSAVKNRANQSTEVLFIEQCYKFLREGAYLAVVIPDGILTNSSLQYVRDQIEDWFRIVAVVSMPQTAFSHTGAGVKSSVLFLRKWSNATTQAIKDQKLGIQTTIIADESYEDKVRAIESEKRTIIREHTGFVNETGLTDVRAIEKTDEFKDWKKEITDIFRQKINDLKDSLEEELIERKQAQLNDYKIFMAIAEDIGYDATNRPTGNNELVPIGKELKKFITHINESEAI